MTQLPVVDAAYHRCCVARVTIEYPAGASRLENGQFPSHRANLTIVKASADFGSQDEAQAV
jgi:hypothetical protein